MTEKIKLIKPYISFEEVETELKAIFDSGQLTKGKNVQKFTESLTSYIGAKHAFLTTSATTALTMCLKVLNIKAGDKVAVSDFSFPATANVVEDLGAIPVFIDVDIATYNMSAVDLRKKLNSEFKAVIFVDAFGNPSGIDEIMQICQGLDIPVIQDSACAIGSSCNGRKVGDIADLTCFSFHPRKLLTTGEGGAILTNNSVYADKLQVKLNHGASGLKGSSLDFVDFGYNYRMSEIQALMGWKQLLKLDEVVVERQAIFDRYKKGLEPLGFKAQKVADDCYHNVQSVVLKVPENIDRDSLIADLRSVNIESTIGTYCLSGATFYKNKYNDVQTNSQFLEDSTITLPCYESLDTKLVIKAIKEVLL